MAAPSDVQARRQRLADALDELPRTLRHAFEFRHESWFAEPVMELLRAHGVALVIADRPEIRAFQTRELTTDFTFVRFHHGTRGRRGNYSPAELADWAAAIRAWSADHDVYAYFNNDWEGIRARQRTGSEGAARRRVTGAFRAPRRWYGLAFRRSQSERGRAAMSQTEKRDPRKGAKPPFGEQEQSLPGSDADLRPPADHGEKSYRGTGKLEDLATVVTGADSGIGRAVALAFAREGADVVISYLEEDEDAAETARLVEAAGRQAIQVRGDLGDPKNCRRSSTRPSRSSAASTSSSTTPRRRRCTIVRGDHRRGGRARLPDERLPALHPLPHGVPLMPAGGAIINTASIQAYDPAPVLLHYASTKGAIVTFTKGLSKELSRRASASTRSRPARCGRR